MLHGFRRGRRAVLSACVGGLLALAASGASAQLQRPFPQTALRGSIAFGQTPEIAVNGRAARLAPGSRIRGPDNLIVLPATLTGQRYTVHYVVGFDGNVGDVWILTPEELARRPWPTTPEEAARWQFNSADFTWTRQ